MRIIKNEDPVESHVVVIRACVDNKNRTVNSSNFVFRKQIKNIYLYKNIFLSPII